MIDYHNVLTIFHLFGVVIGMGGALMSDFMFFSSIHDEKISHTEIRFLKLGSLAVWLGLTLIIISGLLLFGENPDRYLNSPKFLAKMTIVLVLIVNGIIFHFIHIPRLFRHAGAHFPSSDEFMRKASLLLISGAVSMISWFSALILGVLKNPPYTYFQIMAIYLFVLAFGIITVLLFKKKFIPHFK